MIYKAGKDAQEYILNAQHAEYVPSDRTLFIAYDIHNKSWLIELQDAYCLIPTTEQIKSLLTDREISRVVDKEEALVVINKQESYIVTVLPYNIW